MDRWVVYALVSMAFAGFTSVSPSLAMTEVNPANSG